ncbi:MAG: hypothetical protein ACRC5M_02475 [Anaeroplasmataceae bacterium]
MQNNTVNIKKLIQNTSLVVALLFVVITLYTTQKDTTNLTVKPNLVGNYILSEVEKYEEGKWVTSFTLNDDNYSYVLETSKIDESGRLMIDNDFYSVGSTIEDFSIEGNEYFKLVKVEKI